MLIWNSSAGSLSLFRGRSPRYSDGLHDFFYFSFTIPKCYKDVHVNSSFPRTVRLWKSLSKEYFPLTYDLNGFKSRINGHLFFVCRFPNRFLVDFNIFLFFFFCFFVTPCSLVALQSCMDGIPIKKRLHLTIYQGSEYASQQYRQI